MNICIRLDCGIAIVKLTYKLENFNRVPATRGDTHGQRPMLKNSPAATTKEETFVNTKNRQSIDSICVSSNLISEHFAITFEP